MKLGMLKTVRTFLPVAFVFVLSLTMLAQSPIQIPDYIASPGAEKVVQNAPYSAQRHFTSVRKLADGKTTSENSSGSDARDSQGRTYNAGERHWTYMKGQQSVLGTEMLYRIEDPLAGTTTRWDSSSKEAKVIHWPSPHATVGADCAFCGTPDLPDKKIEKLGDKVIQGLRVEGTRMSYTIPAEASHKRDAITVVHEVWYSPDLKIAILATNDDPQGGTTRDEVINIVRGEPDVSRYQPPADYVIRKIEIPQQPPSQ